MEKKKLGILGGMGSEATVLFYKKIIDNTSVNNDREHLDILIYNHASIPDRTECILCGKQDYLWDIIANDIRGMEQLGPPMCQRPPPRCDAGNPAGRL